MAFAPFPPPTYLSDGSRTEGEMKTAFENWLLATQQTSGHGQCRLLYTSPTALTLVPFEGRRVLLADNAYEVPAAGLTVSNAGVVASTVYYALLGVTAGVVTLRLYHAAGSTIVRVVDPDSGISMLSGDGGATVDHSTTVVGMVTTNAAAQFTEIGTCSLHGRRLKTHGVVLSGDVVGGSASFLPVLSTMIAAFAGDSVQCVGALTVLTGASTAFVQLQGGGVTPTRVASWNVAGIAYATLALNWHELATDDKGIFAQLGFIAPTGAPITAKADGGSTLYITRLG